MYNDVFSTTFFNKEVVKEAKRVLGTHNESFSLQRKSIFKKVSLKIYRKVLAPLFMNANSILQQLTEDNELCRVAGGRDIEQGVGGHAVVHCLVSKDDG